MDESPASQSAGWMVVQLAALLQRMELARDRAMTALHRVPDGMEDEATIVIDSDRVYQAVENVHEISQLAMCAEQLVEALDDRAIPVAYEQVARSAAQELAASEILEVDRVLLALRLLHRNEGLRALASCLRESDAYTAWTDATVADLLGSIRGVTPQLVRRIATAAIAPGAEVASLEPEEIQRLIMRIDVHAHVDEPR